MKRVRIVVEIGETSSEAFLDIPEGTEKVLEVVLAAVEAIGRTPADMAANGLLEGFAAVTRAIDTVAHTVPVPGCDCESCQAKWAAALAHYPDMPTA